MGGIVDAAGRVFDRPTDEPNFPGEANCFGDDFRRVAETVLKVRCNR